MRAVIDFPGRAFSTSAGLGCAGFFALFQASASARAATPVAAGTLAGDQTWTAAQSPYLLAGDLTVPGAVTLTLEPGVEVRVSDGDSLAAGLDAHRIELTVIGSLLAEGTAASPIELRSQNDLGANAWYGIVVDAAATQARLSHVAISDANNAVQSAAPGSVLELSSVSLSHNVAGVWLSAGTPSLDGLLLSSNSAYGVFALANADDLSFSLRNSVARLNGSYGVYLSSALGHTLTVTIESSTLHGNTSSGVSAQASGAASKTTILLRNTNVSSNGISGVDASEVDDGVVSFSAVGSDVWSNGQNFSGSAACAGCLSEDPLYVDAPADLRLTAGSPCIDSGTADGAPAIDLLSVARPQGAGFDIGAYEFSATSGGAVENAGGASGTAAGAPAAAGGAPAAVGGAPAAGGGAPAAVGGAPAAVPAASARSGCSCELADSAMQRPSDWLGLLFLGLVMRRRKLELFDAAL